MHAMNSLLALIAIAMTWVALLTPTTVYCADTYPVKPVRVVAPFAPGGGGDTVARLIAQKLGESLAQPFIVENRPGASNIIGTELVARAAPDGYTLLVMNTVHTINGAIIARLNEAAHKGLAQNDLSGKLAAEAAEAAPGTPEQFAALLQQEVQRYTALARKLKLQAT